MISKERMRDIVVKAVQTFPTKVNIRRKHLNQYKEWDGTYDDVAQLTGVLYKNDTASNIFFSFTGTDSAASNFTKPDTQTYFITDWNADALKVKPLDILDTVDNDVNQRFEIQEPGANMEIYLNMALKEVE